MKLNNEIVQAMEAMGFTATRNDFCIQFLYNQPKRKHVLYHSLFDTVECWQYDENEQHYLLVFSEKKKLDYNLTEWLMLMHVADMMPLPEVKYQIQKNLV